MCVEPLPPSALIVVSEFVGVVGTLIELQTCDSYLVNDIMRPFKMPPQIVRLVLLTFAIVGSYLVARSFLTPRSFGELGWYRAEALA
jgi:hypothetical protein